ncbi:MAG TPA: LytTR family DNA-binding domain-containing protein [Blastocatellia bacterium]|nr:LytTR family DNA-binding domain-containing protein [Blastocatellia bacterium]
MSAQNPSLRVYLVDDEPLALKRLARLLKATGKVQVVGATSDADSALAFLAAERVDALFLDIQMPELNGFELLSRLESQPLVVFTTAFDQYALRAFEVNSIDYLLKPIETEQLDRAISKIERLRGAEPRQDVREVVERLAAALQSGKASYPDKVASRSGERIWFIELSTVTHFLAKDKMTYAVTAERSYVIDSTIAELEQKLDPSQFLRIHRSTLLNLSHVQEVNSWFAGGVVVRLKDAKRTELTVARDRVRALKQRLGF